jgi:hypothetical protein
LAGNHSNKEKGIRIMSENSTENNAPVEAEVVQEVTTADSNERTLGLVCHLSLFASFIVPFASFIIPLVIWLMKRETSQFLDATGKEVLNFQITLLIASIACCILMIILIGIPLLFAIAIAAIVFDILGAVAASKGEIYRYPFILRLIK